MFVLLFNHFESKSGIALEEARDLVEGHFITK